MTKAASKSPDDIERLVRKVLEQREDQDQTVNGDADGLAQSQIGIDYAEKVLSLVQSARSQLRATAAD